jgi:cell division protein FtsQ
MISASNIESNKPLSNVEVHIISGKKYHFIEETQILDEAINKRGIDIAHTPVGKIDIKAMEQVLEADPWVARAQLYVDNNRVLQMVVTQRIPVARLFEQNGTSCYMDNTLHTMPLAANFNFYTSVVTNVPPLGTDSMSWMIKKQIVTLLHTIQADTFWNAQVSQVVIDSDFSFELLPVLGDQLILFGDTSRAKEKLDNLYAFYKKVLNRIGWDKYEKLDLRFKGQVIASPSLPYKGPVDKANATMNWLSAFVETEVKKDSLAALAENKGKGPDAGVAKDEPKPEAKRDAAPVAGDKGKILLTPTKDAKAKDAPKGKEVPKPVAHAAPREAKKEVKKEAKKEVKKDAKKEVKKEVKKDAHKEQKKEPKKEAKKDVKKDAHAGTGKKHEEPKKENKAKDKPKEKQ